MEVEKEKITVSLTNSKAYRDFRDCKASIDLDVRDEKIPLSHLMLTFPWRDYVVKKIKTPLSRAIANAKRFAEMAPVLVESTTRLKGVFGLLTKDKMLHQNTFCIIDHKAKFLSYETCVHSLKFEGAAYDILIAENEHDPEYRHRFDTEIEWIVEDILSGKWKPRPPGCPVRNWKEPAPYGGEHSIVFKLQKHREEILKLIEGE